MINKCIIYRSKPKRKRIKKMSSDSDSDVQEVSQGTPNKSGRKNIRKVLKDKQVAEDTKQAAKEEEERLKRIAERQILVRSRLHYHLFFAIDAYVISSFLL